MKWLNNTLNYMELIKEQKVIIVVGEINKAGVANAALNFYRVCSKFYKDKIAFDFVTTVEPNDQLKEEFERIGTKYFVIKRIREQGFKNYVKQLRQIIKVNGPYVALHSHLGDKNWLACKAAKKQGIKNIVAHAHGSVGLTPIHSLATKFVFARLNRKYSTKRFACSNKSGKYTFKKDFEFLPNVISSDNVTFDHTKNLYDELRVVKDTRIIGYLGVFEEQKNAEYLLQIMNRYQATKQNVICLMAGNGSLFEDVKQKAASSKNIRFLGYRNDANDLLRIFDVLVMPSLSEGMSMSLLSAQLIGTPCVVSNGVPNTNDLGFGLFTKVSDFNVNKWCDAINAAFTVDKRKDFNDINERFEKLKVIGYDEETIAKRLIEAYLH